MIRRGSTIGEVGYQSALCNFKEDDIVQYSVDSDGQIIGVVLNVNPKENKVYVYWNSGIVDQHCPDQIVLAPFTDETVRKRLIELSGQFKEAGCSRDRILKSRRSEVIQSNCDRMNSRRRFLTAEVKERTQKDTPPEYSGDPKEHGMDEARGGGFSIMQDLTKKLHNESIEGGGLVSRGDDKKANLTIRRAMYFKERGRVYRKTRRENEVGSFFCPKCKGEMNTDSFCRGVKIVLCPECGWKITTDKVI